MNKANCHFLDSFFYPKSIAVVGASGNHKTFNYSLTANLVNLKFPGKIYPVNPNSHEVLGMKSYPNLRSIEEDVDLVIVSVPASKTLPVIQDCVAKKVKGITIITGGFSETGTEGRKAQDEIRRLLKESGIRATGPNALSPLNTENGLAICFNRVEKLIKGGLSFIFQSGLYEPRLNWFSDYNLRISKLLDLGNKMDINEVDALEYLAQDTKTKVIALHLESIAGDARIFTQLLKDAAAKKPVIVLKSGRTTAGAKAAGSHTGALIRSSDIVFDTAFKQSGAIRVKALDEFFDLAKAFEYLPPLKRNRVATLSFSGGEGVIATDLCELNGLTMAELSTESHRQLSSVFPPWEIPLNPFDIGVCFQFHDGAEVYGTFLKAVTNDPNVDGAAIHLTTFSIADPARLIQMTGDVVKKGKALVAWVTDPVREKAGIIREVEINGVPIYSSAERAITALSALYRYGARHQKRECQTE